MILVIKTQQGEHLGFVLFSSTDDKCIIQITPHREATRETAEYTKINEYSDSQEYTVVKVQDGFRINGNQKPAIYITFENEEGRMTFEGDAKTSIPVFSSLSCSA